MNTGKMPEFTEGLVDMERIAVVGANSYLARNLIFELLKDQNCDLALYDYQNEYADGAKNYTSVNVLDHKSVDKIDFSVDIIYLFTGKTGSFNGFADFEQYIQVNEIGLLNILNEYVRQKSNAILVFPSTRLVYKGQTGRLAEDAEKEFKTIYAMNKFACEQYLKQFSNVFGVRYCIVRICLPYGTTVQGASSYGTVGFMLSMALQGKDITVYGNGAQRRTLTHIEDLTDVFQKVVHYPDCINDVFNVGGEDYSIREIAVMIAARYHVGVSFIPWPEEQLIIESGDTVFEDAKLIGIIGEYRKNTFAEWLSDREI